MIRLWDLQENRTYIRINKSLLESFFKRAVKTVGSFKQLQKLIKDEHIWYYMTGRRFVSLSKINKIIDILPAKEKLKFSKLIEKNVEKIRLGYGGNAKPISNPLPIKVSHELAGIAGHLVGDGGINAYDSFIVHYTNKETHLVKKFKNYIEKIFGEIPYWLYLDKRRQTYTIRFPGIIGLILTTLFEVEMRGKYKRVPLFVKSGDKEIKSTFLSALFDDEGCVNVPKHMIFIQMTSYSIIKEIKNILKEFDIKAGKISKMAFQNPMKRNAYKINLSGKSDLEKFSKEIGFYHLNKKEKLKILLKSYQRSYSKIGETKKLILKELEKKRDLTIYDLAKKLKRNHLGLRDHLIELERKGSIKSIFEENKKHYFSNK